MRKNWRKKEYCKTSGPDEVTLSSGSSHHIIPQLGNKGMCGIDISNIYFALVPKYLSTEKDLLACIKMQLCDYKKDKIYHSIAFFVVVEH